MRPIPRNLLIHSASVFSETGKDAWGNATVQSDAVQLQRIRLEPSSRIIKDKQNSDIQLACILFYDCVHSRPCDFVFQYDDVIECSSGQYRIVSIEPLYDARRLHHMEIGMVRYHG